VQATFIRGCSLFRKGTKELCGDGIGYIDSVNSLHDPIKTNQLSESIMLRVIGYRAVRREAPNCLK